TALEAKEHERSHGRLLECPFLLGDAESLLRRAELVDPATRLLGELPGVVFLARQNGKGSHEHRHRHPPWLSVAAAYVRGNTRVKAAVSGRVHSLSPLPNTRREACSGCR